MEDGILFIPEKENSEEKFGKSSMALRRLICRGLLPFHSTLILLAIFTKD
jgi:hypothetical protein